MLFRIKTLFKNLHVNPMNYLSLSLETGSFLLHKIYNNLDTCDIKTKSDKRFPRNTNNSMFKRKIKLKNIL